MRADPGGGRRWNKEKQNSRDVARAAARIEKSAEEARRRNSHRASMCERVLAKTRSGNRKIHCASLLERMRARGQAKTKARVENNGKNPREVIRNQKRKS
jgi:hypothetical protein